jgi:hypothetical protein
MNGKKINWFGEPLHTKYIDESKIHWFDSS